MIKRQKIRLSPFGDQKSRNNDVTFDDVLAKFQWRDAPKDGRTALRIAIELIKTQTELRVEERGRRRNDNVRQDLIDLEALSLAIASSINRLSPSPLPGNAFLGDPQHPAPVVVLDNFDPDACHPMGAAADEIAATARRLAGLIGSFRAQFATDPDRSKVDVERHEFVQAAAIVWDKIAARSATASRSGPFARFCAMAWLEGGFPAPDTDTISTIGAVAERVVKSRKIASAQLR